MPCPRRLRVVQLPKPSRRKERESRDARLTGHTPTAKCNPFPKTSGCSSPRYLLVVPRQGGALRSEFRVERKVTASVCAGVRLLGRDGGQVNNAWKPAAAKSGHLPILRPLLSVACSQWLYLNERSTDAACKPRTVTGAPGKLHDLVGVVERPGGTSSSYFEQRSTQSTAQPSPFKMMDVAARTRSGHEDCS